LIPAKFLGHKREENIMKKKRETEKKKPQYITAAELTVSRIRKVKINICSRCVLRTQALKKLPKTVVAMGIESKRPQACFSRKSVRPNQR
jgi:hypothetical protein